MDIFEARWNNAIKVAGRINQYIDEGYIVMNEEKEIISRFVITDDRIYTQDFQGKTRYVQEYFEKNKDYDHGMHTTIDQFNAGFLQWTIAKKIDMKNILAGR